MVAGSVRRPCLAPLLERGVTSARDPRLPPHDGRRNGALVAFAQASALRTHDQADARAERDGALALNAAAVSRGQAETQMIRYVEANAARCGIPPQIGEQLKAGRRNTEAMLQKVCRVAHQMRRGPHGPVRINDIGDPAMEDPYLFQISPLKKSGPTSLE